MKKLILKKEQIKTLNEQELTTVVGAGTYYGGRRSGRGGGSGGCGRSG